MTDPKVPPREAESPLDRALQAAHDALVALPSDAAAAKQDFDTRIRLVQEAQWRIIEVMENLFTETDPERAKKARALIAETKKLAAKETKLLATITKG